MRVIGIDLGSSTIKGGVLNAATGSIEHEQRAAFPPALPSLPRGHFEVAPQDVLSVADAVLDALLGACPDAQAVMLCSQMHGAILTDERGRALTNLMTWQDQRANAADASGVPYVKALLNHIGAEWRCALGNDVWAARPVAMLNWMARNGVLPAHAYFCALPDFVGAHWCGAPVATDRTHAAASGMYDVERDEWHRKVADRLGLGALALPSVVTETAIIGRFVRKGHTLDLLAPISDQQCALLGAGLLPGQLSINVSTGSQVAVLSAARVFGAFQTRPYVGDGWLNTLIHLPAGRSLNALVRLLSELAWAEGISLAHAWRTLEQAAGATHETDLDIDLSFYAGALGDRGTISNLREDNLSVGHLFRAAFAQMARNYHDAARVLDPTGSWRSVLLSGGLVRQSPTLQAEIAEAFGCAVQLAPGGEDALEGMLRLLKRQ